MPSRLPPFDADLAAAKTLPAFAYTDAGILAEEHARIFRRTWQPLAGVHVADLADPGSFATAELSGAPVVVLRDDRGQLRGFYNVCRHRAGPVAVGRGKRKLLTCRYHGWSYRLDGSLVTTPELGQARDFDKACHGLRPIAVETWGPFVFVNLADSPPPLASVLGKIPEETKVYGLEKMTSVGRKDYELSCNWKVYVDNFLEGYHLPSVHPGLYRELDYGEYRVETHAFHSSQIAPIRPKTGEGVRHYAPVGGDLAALYYWVFPNWMLNIYPDNMSLNVIVPVGPAKTVTIFEWFRRDPSDKEAIHKTIAFSDGIQDEDIDICEHVQRGLASGAYDHGRFSTTRENGVHHFQGLVHRFLTQD